jgi:hypothetical protein
MAVFDLKALELPSQLSHAAIGQKISIVSVCTFCGGSFRKV